MRKTLFDAKIARRTDLNKTLSCNCVNWLEHFVIICFPSRAYIVCGRLYYQMFNHLLRLIDSSYFCLFLITMTTTRKAKKGLFIGAIFVLLTFSFENNAMDALTRVQLIVSQSVLDLCIQLSTIFYTFYNAWSFQIILRQ